MPGEWGMENGNIINGQKVKVSINSDTNYMGIHTSVCLASIYVDQHELALGQLACMIPVPRLV